MIHIRTGLVVLGLTIAAPSLAATKVECIAANEQAQDARRTGKFSAAREQLALCIDGTCPEMLRDDCSKRLDELDRAQPTVAFDVKDATGTDLTAVRVRMDGAPLADKLNGAALRVDPGSHAFEFLAEGRPVQTRNLVVVEGDQGRHVRVVLGYAGQPAGGRWPPVLAIIAGAVGLAGLAVGVGAGLAGTSAHSSLSGECNVGSGTCPPPAQNDLDAFHAWRTVSTVGYVVGSLGLLAGGVLFFAMPTASKDSTAATTEMYLGLGSGGVAGRF